MVLKNAQQRHPCIILVLIGSVLLTMSLFGSQIGCPLYFKALETDLTLLSINKSMSHYIQVALGNTTGKHSMLHAPSTERDVRMIMSMQQ